MSSLPIKKFASVLTLSTLLAASGAYAKNYPTRAITFVVPVTAGTATDVLTRTVASHMSKQLGQSIVVDNRPGASGNIGVEHVIQSAPDGYTVLVSTTNVGMAPALFPNLKWDPIKDLIPVGMLVELPLAISVNSGVEANTVAELVELAKKHPGKLNYASPGNATPHHFGMELFKRATGIDMVHVPYKGTGGAVTDLAAGRVQVSYFSMGNVLPFVKDGRMRILATASESRLPWTPEIPTLRELNLESAEIVPWVGMFVPSGTDKEVVDTLSKALAEALNDPSVHTRIMEQGNMPAPRGPAEMGEALKSDVARWKSIVADTGLSAQ